MLRITKQTDYGIVLMTHLALQPEAQQSAPELAESLHIPLPMVSKILKLLAKDGLLVSQRGVRGGYGLARSPERLTVAEIVHALEGPIAVTECIEEHGPGDCARISYCAVRGNWQVINGAVMRALEGITLAEMTHPLRAAQAAQLVAIGGKARAATPA